MLRFYTRMECLDITVWRAGVIVITCASVSSWSLTLAGYSPEALDEL